jgi:hypothetical protein
MNEVRQQKFSLDRQKRIRDVVTFLRTRGGGNNRTHRNFRFHSVNTGHDPSLSYLYHLLTRSLPANIRNQVQSSRLYLRYVSGGLRNYALLQRLHRNIISNPREGVAFLQFIYYIDTPKIANVNAPPNERGALILHPAPNVEFKFVPEKGRIVFFNPTTTYHEVTVPAGRVAGNVNRNMIIGFLFAKTNNPTPSNLQNLAHPLHAAGVRMRLEAGGARQIPFLVSPTKRRPSSARLPKTTLVKLRNAKNRLRTATVARQRTARQATLVRKRKGSN